MLESSTDTTTSTEQTAAEVARTHIDEEILKLEENIRKLKSTRNTFSTSSRLPPEILSAIFIDYASSFTPYSQVIWIQITHVSRHWRTVALNCPKLWSTIPCSSIAWVTEMLKRSKSAPIFVTAIAASKKTKAILEALSHFRRIRNLDLRGDISLLKSSLEDLPPSTSLLHTLSICNAPQGSIYLMNASSSECFALSKGFLEGGTPSLRRLELVKCVINWDSPLYCGLVHLKLHCIKLEARPSTQQLVHMLEKCPALETLDLDESLPSVGNDLQVLPPGRIIHLSSLVRLKLKGSVPECYNFLSHVSFPWLTTMRIECSRAGSRKEDFTSLISALSSSRHIPEAVGEEEAPHIHGLHVSRNDYMGIALQAWLENNDPIYGKIFPSLVSKPVDDTPLLDLFLSWQSPSSPGRDVLADVCNGLPLKYLNALRITAPVDTSTWTSAFIHRECLNTILIHNVPATPFVSALRKDPALPPKSSSVSNVIDEDSAAVQYLPELETIMLEEVDLEEGAILDSGFNDLLKVFRLRQKHGAQVLSMIIKDCINISECQVDELEEVIGDVDWDGVERERLEEEDEEDGEDEYEHDGCGCGRDDYDSDGDIMYPAFRYRTNPYSW